MSGWGPVDSSGELSATTQLTTRPTFYYGVELLPPATGAATVKIYDTAIGDTVNGKKISEVTVQAGQNSVYLTYSVPRQLNFGLYVQLTGTTTFVIGSGAT